MIKENEKELLLDVLDLYNECNDVLVMDYFDTDSMEMLNEKKEVLKALNDGTPPSKIENYYKVLELYPKEDYIQW